MGTLINIINEEINSILKEEYADNTLYGYHVTPKENVDNIFKNGLKVGGGTMQGTGLYAFYYLNYDGNAGDAQYYATKTHQDTAIIKFNISPNRILILDPTIAKEVLGDQYLVSDQIKNFYNGDDILERSAKMFNIPVEELEKKINTKFVNDERNWWTSDLVSDYQDLGVGRLFNGEYGMTYIITRPSALNLIGYHDVTTAGYKHIFSKDLKTVEDNRIIDIINSNEKYNIIDKHIEINQLKSTNDIESMIARLENDIMQVRNNREYDLYNNVIDKLGELKIDVYKQNKDTTDYSKKRGIA